MFRHGHKGNRSHGQNRTWIELKTIIHKWNVKVWNLNPMRRTYL